MKKHEINALIEERKKLIDQMQVLADLDGSMDEKTLKKV